MDKVVHKFCFERKMRGRVKLFKSQGETFQGVFPWQTRAASSSTVWSMSIYCRGSVVCSVVCERTEICKGKAGSKKVVHKFCFETEMRAKVNLFKSWGETFQPWEGVFSWQTRAASSSNVWSMSIYCSVVNQNDLPHCMMVVYSGLSLLQTIRAACCENPTGNSTVLNSYGWL